MADEKHDELFKVIDRRPFTAEGELRKEVIEQEKREQEAAAILQKGAGASKGAGKDKQAAGRSGLTGTPETQPGSSLLDAGAETPKPSHNFQMLIDFLARNAAILLGGYADPHTGQAILDLEGAREMIDMLDVLREKTRGNLAPDDDRLLLDVLGSLKMTFLEMSKQAAAAMQEKVKSKT